MLRINEEERAELSCRANGIPEPLIKWYKGNDELPLSNRLEYIKPGKMIIKDIRLSDAGIYTCRAVNSQGYAEENITVIVKSMFICRFILHIFNQFKII